MSDRRAVSAGHLAGASVAASSEPWRVAVGGNRVQSMTVEQIAYAFSAGQLSVRTPLWPPGTSGWQALGNFEQFQAGAPAPDGNYGQLAQFEEADDDPTRMWTGSNDLSELPGMDVPDMMPMPPEPSLAPPSRPSARTGPRQVASRPPRSLAPPAPPVARVSSALPTARSTRPRRGSGVWLVAGLVGLVGLGSAVLAARGNWSMAAPSADAPASEVMAAAPAPAEVPPTTAPANAEQAEGEPNQARLAKYEETQPSAFVAEAEAKHPAAEAAVPAPGSTASDALVEAPHAPAPEARAPEATRTAPAKTSTARPREKAKVSSTTAKRAAPPVVATAAAKPKPAAEPVEPPKEKEPAKEAKAEAPAPASSAVNAAAATALGNAAKLASSCRPRGGPAGDGKARIIYSPDGEVQSVEILTAKFRDTLTASCVRMVFRRAKIPAFKGEPPTFIKSFTIPEE